MRSSEEKEKHNKNKNSAGSSGESEVRLGEKKNDAGSAGESEVRPGTRQPGSDAAGESDVRPGTKQPGSAGESEVRPGTRQPGSDAAGESEGMHGKKQSGSDAAGESEVRPGTKQPGSKRRKILTRTAGVAIILAVVVCMNYIATLCFDEVHVADYYNYDINQLEKENKQVDMVIVGASQVYHACNPDVISEELGIGEVIDCTTASAMFDGQYYMLRDLLRRFHPKYVVLEMSWRRFTDKSSGAKSRGRLLMADRLKWPDKLDYGFHCFYPEQLLNLLLPIYRFGGGVWGFSQLKQNYERKKAVSEGKWVDESERNYRKNGFSWYPDSVEPGSIPAEDFYYTDEKVEEYEVKWARKIVELCNEWEVPIVWMTVPASIVELFDIQNYQGFQDFTTNLASELGVQYLNFSLMKDHDKILPEPLYADRVHLNGEGSVAFSPVFAQIAKRALDGEDVSDYFYKNIDELKNDIDRVVACNGRVNPDEDGMLTVEVKSHQNDSITPEYRLLLEKESALKTAAGGGDSSEGGDEAAGEEADDEAGDEAGDKAADGGAEEGGNAAGDDAVDDGVADGGATEGEAEEGGSAGDGGVADGGATEGEAEEGGSAGDGGVANRGAANGDEEPQDSKAGQEEDYIEIRSWQEETVFIVDPSEIPEGYVLRLEARKQGTEEATAFVDNLSQKFKST